MKNRKPSICCVMVTGKDTARYPLALNSIKAFERQSYQGPLALRIINDNPVPLLPPDFESAREIQEVRVKGNPKSLGELRNLALALAGNTHFMQWDDDDFSHQDRIAWQVEQTNFQQGEATIFRRELHCNLFDGTAFANNGKQSRVGGFAGTMLFPKLSHIRFPHTGKHEDTEFLLQYKARGRLRVLDNQPHMYLRFYHGHNTWSQQHVMQKKPGSRELSQDERAYVDEILDTYYSEIRAAMRESQPGKENQ